MSTHINNAHLEGMHNQSGAGTEIKLTFYDLAGSVITKADANYRSGSLKHISSPKPIMRKGMTASAFNAEEGCEATFDFIAEGVDRTNATTGAVSSAQMPPVLGRVKVENAPVIKCGFFADALNADTSYPFMYWGDGSLTLSDEEAWGGTITLKRFKGMPSYTVAVTT